MEIPDPETEVVERETPSGPDYFEIAGLALLAAGDISEARYLRAMEAHREAVSRD